MTRQPTRRRPPGGAIRIQPPCFTVRPIVHWSGLVLAGLLVLGGGPARAGVITLTEAQVLALERNPELGLQALEVAAAEGARRQAGAFANPELSVEVENFGGDFPAKRRSETTWSVGQQIPWFGKHSARTSAARFAREGVKAEYERAKLDVSAEVERRFGELLAAQMRLEVAEENLRTADTLLSAVTSLAEAGEVSPIEAQRARADRALVSIERDQAAIAVDRARIALGSLWGDVEPAFDRGEGSIATDWTPPERDVIEAMPLPAPDVNRWEADAKRWVAETRFQSWSRLPDPVIGVGMRRLAETEEQTYVASVALPIPFFDRNGGAIAEASARRAQSRLAVLANGVRLRAQRLDAYEVVSGALAESRSLRDGVLPSIRESYAAVSEGYRMGKFRLIDLLDARRSLAEAEVRYIESLSALWRARIDLNRLLGHPTRVNEGTRTLEGATP